MKIACKYFYFLCLLLFCVGPVKNKKVIVQSKPFTSIQEIWNAGEDHEERMVVQLIEMLEDSNYNVRQYAAAALGKITDKRAIEPLIESAITNSSEIENTAVKALSRFGKSGVCRLIKRYVDLIEKEDSINLNPVTQREALVINNILFRKTLLNNENPAQLPLPDSESVLDCLPFPYMGMQRPLQEFTLAVIAASRDSTSINWLKELLLVGDNYFKNDVVKLIVSRGNSTIVPFILKKSISSDSTLSSRIVFDILTGLPDIRSIGYFKKNTTLKNWHIIAQTCKKIGAPVVPEMRNWIKDTSVALRSCASQVLSEFDYPYSRDAILLLLNDTNSILRIAVVDGLRHTKDTSLAPFVYRLNADTGNPRIRYAIEKYHDEENEWILENLLKRCQDTMEKGSIDTLLLNDLLRIIVNDKTRQYRKWHSGTHSVPWESTYRNNILPILDECIASTIPECRKKAFEIKSYMIDSKRNTSIVNGLSSDDPEVLLHALRSIVDSNDSTCYTIPVTSFNNTNYLVRYFATIAASNCTSNSYVPYFLTLLNETGTVIPENEIRWLRVSDSLIRFNMDMPNQNDLGSIHLNTVADAAAYALGCAGDKSVLQALYRYTNKCGSESKMVGLAALKKLSTDLDITFLKRYLASDIHPSTRELAMGCLFHQDITKTNKILVEYIGSHTDLAAVVALKCLCLKTDDNIFPIAETLLNTFAIRDEKYLKLSGEQESAFFRNAPRDTIYKYEYASRLLIQSAIEILHGGHPNGIVPAMKLLSDYDYDCCSQGETWLSALGRVPKYTNNATIDTLVAQLRIADEESRLFNHYVDVLKRQKTTYAVNEVVKLLADHNVRLRTTAAEILYSSADANVIDIIEQYLDDSLPIMRFYAFSILYNMNSVSSSEKLLSSLNSGILDTILTYKKRNGPGSPYKINQNRDKVKKSAIYENYEFILNRIIKFSGVLKKQTITPEFHCALFYMVQAGNMLAEHYLDFSQVHPDSFIARLLLSHESRDRLLALNVYIEHPGTAQTDRIVCLLDDEELEVQIAAGKYLLLSNERYAYKHVYRYIKYVIERFPSHDFSRGWRGKTSIYPLIELCTDTSAIPLHKEILHLNRRKMRFSTYRALLKMDSMQARVLLSSPTISSDKGYIKQFSDNIAKEN